MSLIHHSLGRIIYYSALPLLVVYGKITRPRVRGIIIHENKILFVKNWLSHQQWTFPGGGVARNESELAALRRELNEELGITLPTEIFESIGTFKLQGNTSRYSVSVYVATIKDPALLTRLSFNRRELIDAQWFDMHELPPRFNHELHQIYDSYLSKKS